MVHRFLKHNLYIQIAPRLYTRLSELCNYVTEELIPLLNERAGFPPDTDLVLYEEIKPNMVERIENDNEPLEKVLEELMDGDIIVFQKDERDDMYELPTCRDYFK
jgi:ubiquitin carboxyl-terminal hydrolase 7